MSHHSALRPARPPRNRSATTPAAAATRSGSGRRGSWLAPAAAAARSGSGRRGSRGSSARRGSPGSSAATAAALCFVFAGLVLAPSPAGAWTPKTQLTIAREGARLAPNDLYRQILRHPRELDEGALAPFEDGDPMRHVANPDGSGELAAVIEQEVETAIRAIREHLPFDRVTYQLGVVAHYVADANNPLNLAAADAGEERYFADFLRYAESAEPRLPVVFYGVYPGLEERGSLAPLLDRTFARGRQLYPSIGREYRRIGWQSGIGRFDDRSTAFGVASLTFSHAVSDVGLVFRYIWLRAGGGDFRTGLPVRGARAVRLPRLENGLPPAGAGR